MQKKKFPLHPVPLSVVLKHFPPPSFPSESDSLQTQSVGYFLLPSPHSARRVSLKQNDTAIITGRSAKSAQLWSRRTVFTVLGQNFEFLLRVEGIPIAVLENLTLDCECCSPAPQLCAFCTPSSDEHGVVMFKGDLSGCAL